MTDTSHLRAMVDELRSSFDQVSSDQSSDDTQIDRLISDRSALVRLLSEYRILREALDKSPMAYCVYDQRDRLIAANPAYETRIFGPDRVAVQGKLVGLIRRYH